jgi:hypothetical protein
MPKIFTASALLALTLPMAAQADTAADIETLRREIESIRASYEQRLQALEARLKAAQEQPSSPAVAAAVAPAAPPPAAGRGGANAFNPAISLILSGTYGRTSRDPADYAVTGFTPPPGAEIAPGRGFSLGESELGLSASIDPWLRGQASIALHPDNTVSVEEAFVQTTSLGNGLTLKAGRFFSGIGYLNDKHAHTWDFADNPLAYKVFLGNQFADDGLQLRWLAPTDTYLEAGAEIGRGGALAGDTSRNGAGASALFVHAGGDVGESHSWRAGLSMLDAKAAGTRIWIADGVWKWAPNGNATRTNFKLQGEYLRNERTDSAAQSGWYLQGVYQFMPRWRVGLRTERLDSGSVVDPELMTSAVYKPRKDSLMLEFNPSEFSRLRLQLARDRSRAGLPDNQLLLQYQMSLGAHGAHGF